MAGCNCDKVTFRNLTPPRCSLVALLLLAALAVATAVAQQTPQPVFTDLFTYDPAAPSQLLGKAPDAGLGDYDIGRPYFYRRADGGFCRLRRALWQRAVPVQYRWPCHGRQSVNVKSTSRPGMARWRERLYSGLARIATSCVARPRVNVVNVAPSTPQGVATFTTVGPGCSSSVAATPCYAAMR
jgi:hypothetical protein